jgi:hypothetical protein
MINSVLVAACLAAFIGVANGECANACNGHGKCTSYDMCICNRNWQASDCSERVCMFGLAHVDTPKGDLDMSGALTGPDHLVVDNSFTYPYGTTEQFPQMEDSDLQPLTNSAHYYMECSNKGKCDRTSGECQCYDGYDGVACQRASCPGYPNSCSGHGVCKTIRQLAAADNGNVYQLWDKDSTMGCHCDKGYSGADCSLRQCKSGIDPLYLDDASTVKYSIFDVAVLSTMKAPSNYSSLFTDGQVQGQSAYWALRYYDITGEDWVTRPILAGASCSDVVSALESLPNNVIPSGMTYCTMVSVLNGTENTFTDKHLKYDAQHLAASSHPYKIAYKLALWEDRTPNDYGEISPYTPIEFYTSSNDTNHRTVSGYIYRLKFYGNPGALPEPKVELYLDGKRPSLVSTGAKVITKVWTDGQQGENVDHFADHCDGVTVNIAFTAAKAAYLTGFTLAERNLLKKCLGNSDFDTSNNQDVYNWDKGSKLYPHIIKLVRTVTTYTDGGYYAVIWYDTSVTLDNLMVEGTFKVLNPFAPPDAFFTDNFDVYTTTGTLAMTSNMSEATFGFASKYIYMTNVTYDSANFNTTYGYDGDISCEVGNNNAYKFEYIFHCLNKTDLFTVLNWEYPQYNPPHINLYTAQRLYTTPFEYSNTDRFGAFTTREMHYMTHVVTTDVSTNWGVSVGIKHGQDINVGAPNFHVYKFFPATASDYTYVAPCSNRGICDTDSGVCKCFPGYTSDSCHTQNSLSV